MQSSKRLVAAALMLAFAMVLDARLANAQATTGELTGRIMDAAGAVVPGVAVTARGEESGLVRTTATNASGEYLLLLLPPGRYTVEAELAGFKKVERRGVAISIGPARACHCNSRLELSPKRSSSPAKRR